MKLVYVTKRGQSDQYLVLATTKLSLKPDEIIPRVYNLSATHN